MNLQTIWLIWRQNVRDYLMAYIPVYMFLTCSSLLFMFSIPDCNTSDSAFFFVVCETTRRQQWAHVSVWRSSSITGRGCGRLSSTCSASATIATLMGMTGRNMSRQSGWLKHLPPKTLLSNRQTHIHSVLLLCSSQILAKPQASYHSSCDAHICTVWPHM